MSDELKYSKNIGSEESKNSLEEYVNYSIFITDKECTKYYIRYISDILNSGKFYYKNCKIPFDTKKYKDNKIFKDCPLTLAANSFKKNSYWATFHPDWRTSFGKFVIRRGLNVIYITRDLDTIRYYLGISKI